MKVKTKSGLTFSNPIGVGPGLDVYGRGIDGLLDCGFGFVEIGSVTMEQQHPSKLFQPTLKINLKVIASFF
jgi:dihydroorotate dehydrogenase